MNCNCDCLIYAR